MDWLCPYKCRGCGRISNALCECCIFYITQSFHGKSHEFLDGRLFVGGLRDGLLSRCLIDFKYKSVRGLARPLAEILSAAIPEGRLERAVVVPLPTIGRHIRERGFDHTFLLAKELSRMRGWELARILERRNSTVQVGADAQTRIKQASGAYGVNRAILEKVGVDRVFLLVDDIYTTGASMDAAEKALLEAGATQVFRAVVAMNRCIEDDVGEGEEGEE